MSIQIIIALIVVVLWTILLNTQEAWLHTKVGEIIILGIGITSLYGSIIAATNLYEWIIK